jgi:hypothetical protein
LKYSHDLPRYDVMLTAKQFIPPILIGTECFDCSWTSYRQEAQAN